MRPCSALAALCTLLSAAASAQGSSADDSLLWGTYRPGLYFGLRPRLPSTLMTGLIWFGTGDYQSYQSAPPSTRGRVCPPHFHDELNFRASAEPRHECDQRDGLTYSYTEHDGRSAAKQVLNDKENNVRLTIRWIKVAGGDEGAPLLVA